MYHLVQYANKSSHLQSNRTHMKMIHINLNKQVLKDSPCNTTMAEKVGLIMPPTSP